MSKIVEDLDSLVKEASDKEAPNKLDLADELAGNFKKNWENPEKFHEAEWSKIQKVKPSPLVSKKD